MAQNRVIALRKINGKTVYVPTTTINTPSAIILLGITIILVLLGIIILG